VQVDNNFEGGAFAIDVEFSGSELNLKQTQKFTTKGSPGTSKIAPLFFEAKCRKEYTEQFAIKVKRADNKATFTKILACPLDERHAGEVAKLSIGPSGPAIKFNGKTFCEGKWDK
jgi:hypothetical protein